MNNRISKMLLAIPLTILTLSTAIIVCEPEAYYVSENNEVIGNMEMQFTHIEPIDIPISSEPAPEEVEIVEEEPVYSLTEEEIELISLVTMAESWGEPEMGQRLVIDVILNLKDSDQYHNTIKDVIYSPNCFSSVWNGQINKCWIDDRIYQLVLEELESRTNYEVLFFRTDHYHKFGTPMFREGKHYFSTL